MKYSIFEKRSGWTQLEISVHNIWVGVGSIFVYVLLSSDCVYKHETPHSTLDGDGDSDNGRRFLFAF